MRLEARFPRKRPRVASARSQAASKAGKDAWGGAGIRLTCRLRLAALVSAADRRSMSPASADRARARSVQRLELRRQGEDGVNHGGVRVGHAMADVRQFWTIALLPHRESATSEAWLIGQPLEEALSC